jgi:hypothetical protein
MVVDCYAFGLKDSADARQACANQDELRKGGKETEPTFDVPYADGRPEVRIS